MANPCKDRIVMGDQGIFYCPNCMECECCTPEWQTNHADSDYECVRHAGECIFADNPHFPRHVCEPSPGPTGSSTTST